MGDVGEREVQRRGPADHAYRAPGPEQRHARARRAGGVHHADEGQVVAAGQKPGERRRATVDAGRGRARSVEGVLGRVEAGEREGGVPYQAVVPVDAGVGEGDHLPRAREAVLLGLHHGREAGIIGHAGHDDSCGGGASAGEEGLGLDPRSLRPAGEPPRRVGGTGGGHVEGQLGGGGDPPLRADAQLLREAGAERFGRLQD